MLNHMNISHFSLCRKYLSSTLLIAVVITPLAVTAGIYKWTDEAGNVHYGSQRPPDATAERLKIKSGSQPYAEESVVEEKRHDAQLAHDAGGEHRIAVAREQLLLGAHNFQSNRCHG